MRTPTEVERAKRLNEKAAAFFKHEYKKAGVPDHQASQQPPMLAALSALTVLRWVMGDDTVDTNTFQQQLDRMERILDDNQGTFVSLKPEDGKG